MKQLEEGRHFWWSSSPTSASEKISQDQDLSCFECFQGWSLHKVSSQVPVFNHPHGKKTLVFSLCLNRIFCTLINAHCLLSCNWIPLRKAWLSLLYSPQLVFTTLNLPFSRLDSLRLWTSLCVSDTSVTFMVLPYMCSRCVPDSLVVTGPELAPALQTPLPRAEQRERCPLSPSANAPSHAPKALLALVTRAQWWLTSACHQAPVSCSTGSANKAFCVLRHQKRWHSNDNRFF